MTTNKRFLELTPAEIKKAAALTPTERKAVDDFIAAAKALPRSICIAMSDWDDGKDGIEISKRITSGSAVCVANVRKKSLLF